MTLHQQLTDALEYSLKIKTLEKWVNYLQEGGFLRFPTNYQLTTTIDNDSATVKVYFTEKLAEDLYFVPNHVVQVENSKYVVFMALRENKTIYSSFISINDTSQDTLVQELNSKMDNTIDSIRKYE